MKDVFTDRLKKSITERGLTQRMLATLIGTTEQSVSRWANGNRTPNADMLYKMCKALDVSADYLLGLSEERANNMEKLKAELLDKIKKLWEENQDDLQEAADAIEKLSRRAAPTPHGDLIDRREAIIDANERAYDFWLSDDEVNATIRFLNEQTAVIKAEGET